MKTIVTIPENVSLYLFDDEKFVEISSQVVVGNPVEFIVSDCNSINSEMIGNITPPADWAACKYLFDGATWTPNPDYISPRPIPEQE